MITARIDAHSSSHIQPSDYEYVGIWKPSHAASAAGIPSALDFEPTQVLEHQRRTGGHWSHSTVDGVCFCCGLRSTHQGAFYFAPTNEYVQACAECSEELGLGDSGAPSPRQPIAADVPAPTTAAERAQTALSNLGLSQAWDVFQSVDGSASRDEETVCDLVDKLMQHGRLSDRQIEYLRGLVERVASRKALRAQWDAEKADALPCPTGRVEVTGTLLTVKNVEGYYGVQTKMLVKAKEGYTLWGTKPSSLKAEIGDVITFRATVEPSSDDPKHGYFSRPTAQKV